MSNVPDAATAVLDYWFRELPPTGRFARNADTDAEIARRFGALHAELAKAVPAAWTRTPAALLAAVIVLDQFSRNLYRNRPQAFAQDRAALALAEAAVANSWDRGMTSAERQFLYMPFMHAEDGDAQRQSVELFSAGGLDEAASYARDHAETIERFGRFPWRNRALDRETTTAEQAYLKAHPFDL